MKKLILTLAVVGVISFTSCKKTAEGAVKDTTEAVETVGNTVTETAEIVTETAEGAVDGLPDFESEDAKTFAVEYKTFLEETMEATKSGDAAKIQELQTKSTEWASKMQDLAKNLSAEDAKKLQEFSTKLAQEAMSQ